MRHYRVYKQYSTNDYICNICKKFIAGNCVHFRLGHMRGPYNIVVCSEECANMYILQNL